MWQLRIRILTRAIHAIGGGLVLLVVVLLAEDIFPVPKWWVAIYISILTFYFIELRDPPKSDDDDPTEEQPDAVPNTG